MDMPSSNWTPSGRRLVIVGLPGCGRPHLSRKVRKTPSLRGYLFPSFGLTNFGVLGVCNVERWRATRGSFTFGISTIQRTLSLLACSCLACLDSALRAENLHALLVYARTMSTNGFLAHSLVPSIHN